MSGRRETAMAALFATVSPAYGWASSPSRRLKLWSDVPSASRPALFLHEGGNDRYSGPDAKLRKRVLEAKLFVYVDAHGSNGSSALNEILDAIDAALEPKGGDILLGRQTLNGAAYDCRIDGTVFKDPGDLDGDGMAIIPVIVTLP